MAAASLPVPVEVLETVLRFVPVNENFRAFFPSNQIAPPESRDTAFSSMRIGKFWRLQFVYKQWMEIVQLYLGEFELKLSVTFPHSFTATNIETATIWNRFVAFNLSKEHAKQKGLDQLRSAYLNCYVSSIKLFLLIPPAVKSLAAEKHLSRVLHHVAAFFPDRQLPLELRLQLPQRRTGLYPGYEYFTEQVIDDYEPDRHQPQAQQCSQQPVCLSWPDSEQPFYGSAEEEAPREAVEPIDEDPRPPWAPVLLAGGGGFFPCPPPPPEAVPPTVLPSNFQLVALSVFGLGPYIDLLQSILCTGLTSLTTIACDSLLLAPALLRLRVNALQPADAVYPNITKLTLLEHGGRLLNQEQSGAIPRYVAAFPNLQTLRLPRDPNVAAGSGILDLSPLLQLNDLTDLEFTWPDSFDQSTMQIEHGGINKFCLNIHRGTVPAFAFTKENCQKWLKVAKCLNSLGISGLSHYQLWEFATQMDDLSLAVDFSRLESVHLSLVTDKETDEMRTGIGVMVAFDKFQQHFPVLTSLILEMKPDEVPDDFGRYVLENVPAQTECLQLINVFQNRNPAKGWKTWICEVVNCVMNHVSRANRVKIICCADCFANRYDGLDDFCHSLSEDTRQAYFDFAAYLSRLDSVVIKQVYVLKQASISAGERNAVNADYRMRFIVRQRSSRVSAAHVVAQRLKISFCFKGVV